MIQQIFAVVAPVLLIALLGYAWDRKGLPFDTSMVSYLSSNIGAPCLLLSTLLTRRPDPSAMLAMMAATTAMMVITGAVGYASLRALRQPMRVYLAAMMFPNVGNMGIPLTMFAFGAEGLVAAVAVFATVSLFQFSLGISLASGRFSWREVLSSPVLWAMAAGLLLLIFDIKLPAFLGNTIDVLAGLVIPLMLLSLGTSLARLRITSLGSGLVFAAARIGGGFIVAAGITHVLGMSGAARGALFIQSSMPTAVFNYLFALRYDNQPQEVAGIVVISTIVSFVTLPLLMAYVLG
jgi:predicted permease